MEYDVFISCKSEDYELAEEIYYFLKTKGINVFFAPKELRDPNYTNELFNALQQSSILIVYVSRPEFLLSPWLECGWTTFLNEILSGRKQGRILTIIGDNMTISDLPFALRRVQSIPFRIFRNELLKFIPIDKIPPVSIYSADGKTLLEVDKNVSGHYEIKNGVEIIGDWAFSECKNLSSVAIPESVVQIGQSAFSRCDSLQSIILKSGKIRNIGEYAFFQCNRLSTIYVPIGSSFGMRRMLAGYVNCNFVEQ